MPKRIGIIGGGQLGRFLSIAAQRLGYRVIVLDPTPNSPAGQVADKQILGDFKDAEAIRKLAKEIDYLTFEIELTDAKILDELTKQGIRVAPSAESLNIIKDKLKQKQFLRDYNIPVAEFQKIECYENIIEAAKIFGYPLLLKARLDAYDGRGNALIENPEQIEIALKKLSGRELYAEKFVPFIKELAINIARNIDGEIITHPLVETIHKNNICHIVKAAPLFSNSVQDKAISLATKVIYHFKGAGLFSIEMFLTKDYQILINEIAPRVHNSGHYTMEACETCQFEQHIRAITGMPLGKTAMKFPAAVMINILGDRIGLAEPKGVTEASVINNVKIYIYGKTETRPERKMGHITAVGNTIEEAMERATKARNMISI